MNKMHMLKVHYLIQDIHKHVTFKIHTSNHFTSFKSIDIYTKEKDINKQHTIKFKIN